MFGHCSLCMKAVTRCTTLLENIAGWFATVSAVVHSCCSSAQLPVKQGGRDAPVSVLPGAARVVGRASRDRDGAQVSKHLLLRMACQIGKQCVVLAGTGSMRR